MRRLIVFLMLCSSLFATTYYVNEEGVDGNNGTSLATACTLKKASLLVVPGDTVYVEGTADYTTESDSNGCILYGEVDGNQTDPIKWIGCSDLNDLNDGGVATLDGGGTISACVGGTISYYSFQNFHFTDADDNGITATSDDFIYFRNCRFSNNDGIGIVADNFITVNGCLFDNNGDDGVNVDDDFVALNSIAFSNDDIGMFCNMGVFINCDAIENVGNGLQGGSAGLSNTFYGCIVDGNNVSAGIVAGATYLPCIITNCLLYDCTTGITGNASAYDVGMIQNNCFYSCATNATNLVGPGDSFYAVAGNYVASSDPFGSDPGGGGAGHDTGTMLDAYTIGSGEYKTGAHNAGRDISVVKDFWDDFIDGTNPPGNAEAPRSEMDIGSEQIEDSGGGSTTPYVRGKNGGKQ